MTTIRRKLDETGILLEVGEPRLGIGTILQPGLGTGPRLVVRLGCKVEMELELGKPGTVLKLRLRLIVELVVRSVQNQTQKKK